MTVLRIFPVIENLIRFDAGQKSLSIKNQWFDEENRAYIYFSIEDIMELLNCGRNKAVKSLQELDDEKGIGLIEKRRQGFGKV